MRDHGERQTNHSKWAVLATLGLIVATVPGAFWAPSVGADIDTEQAKLIPSDAEADDRVGRVVAVDADTMVVGAHSVDGVGAAYVFVRSGTGWTEQAKLKASDAAEGDLFGFAIAISGETVVVGARGNDDAGKDSGSAYVFVRSGSTWSQQAKLTASDAELEDFFGGAVAISGDTVVIGADEDDDPGVRPGSAYVFERSGFAWSEQAKLTSPHQGWRDAFGVSVAVSGDTVVVGAQGTDNADDPDRLRRDSGSAFVYVRTGSVWVEQAELRDSHPLQSDNLGFSVAVSGDTVVAANRKDSAFVFHRTGSVWVEQAELTDPDGSGWFGNSVAVSGDTVVVSDDYDSDAGGYSGLAHVFKRSGSSWMAQPRLQAADSVAAGLHGRSVAVSGGTVVLGAVGWPPNPRLGAAYVFVEGPPRLLKPGIGAVAEGGDSQVTVDVPVTLSSPAAVPVTVDYTTVDAGSTGFATPGVDHAAAAGTLTFAPGETSKVVSLTILGDHVYEPDLYMGEWALVKFSNPVGATVDSHLGGHGIAVIVNDDPVPTVMPGSQGVAEGNAGSTVVEVPVTLSNPSSQTVTVDYATLDNPAEGYATPGADFEATSGTVTFAPGETSKSIPVTVLGDTLDEPPLLYGEWIVIEFSNPANATIGTGLDAWGLGVIVDDD